MKIINHYYKKIVATIAQYLLRARDANLVQLPKAFHAGANCKNCHYWRETSDKDIGYCWKPEVSVFVTGRQVCGQWAADGTISKWDNVLTRLTEDLRDRPPAVDGTEINKHGAIIYKNHEHIARAAAVRMKTLPAETKGANCASCLFSEGKDKWCVYPKINQPVDKNDKCKYWDHPGAQTLKVEK